MPFTVSGDWVPSNKDSNKHSQFNVFEQKRKGKTLTCVKGWSEDPEVLKETLKYLKRVCHCGGTFKEGIIELQGSMKNKVLMALKDIPKGTVPN